MNCGLTDAAESSETSESSSRKCFGTYNNTWNNCVGTYTAANGAKYVGQFKDDQMNGAGIFFAAKGQDVLFEERVQDVTENIVHNSTVNTVFPELKNKFNALSISKRLEIQSNLKRQNLYTYFIDGKWGRGTLMALVEYSSKNLGTVDLRSASASQKLLDAVLQ